MTRNDAVIDNETTDHTDTSAKDQTMSEPTIDDETTDTRDAHTDETTAADKSSTTAPNAGSDAAAKTATDGETTDGDETDSTEADDVDEAFDAISIVFDDIADAGIDYDIDTDDTDDAADDAADETITDGDTTAADDIVETNAARVNETLALASTTSDDTASDDTTSQTANDDHARAATTTPTTAETPVGTSTAAAEPADRKGATAASPAPATPGVEPTLRLSARLDAELRQRGNVDDMLRDYPALALAKVTVADRKTGRSIIDRVSAEFRAGHVHAIRVRDDDERIALMGVVTGMMRPTDGAVMNKSLNVLEIEPGELLTHRIGVIPQRYAVRDDLNAEQNLLYAMDASGRTFLKPKPVYARELLQRVGFDSQTPNAPLATLPAVERRLVAVARAICCDAEVIVADEPTGGLDTDDAVVVLRALMALTHGDPKRCVVIVTADDEVAEIAETVTYLSE